MTVWKTTGTTGTTAASAGVPKLEHLVDLDIVGGLEMMGILKVDNREEDLLKYLQGVRETKTTTLMVGVVFESLTWDLSTPVEERVVRLFSQVSTRLQEQGWATEIGARSIVRRELLVQISSFLVPSSLRNQMRVYSEQKEACPTLAEYAAQLHLLARAKEEEYQASSTLSIWKSKTETVKKTINFKLEPNKQQAKKEESQPSSKGKSASRRSTSVPCWGCQGFGHKFEDCNKITPEQKIELRKKLQTKGVSTRATTHLSRLEVHGNGNMVAVQVGGVSAQALLDSGADLNFISTKRFLGISPARYQELQQVVSSTIHVILPDGRTISPTYRILVPLALFEEKFDKVEFWVLDHLSTDVILGDKFLRSQGINIKDMLQERLGMNTMLSSVEAGEMSKEENFNYNELNLREDEEYKEVISSSVPPIENLFPILLDKENEVTEEERVLINQLYADLNSLLYNGNEAMKGEDFTITLKDGYTPYAAKGRRFQSDVFHFLIDHADKLVKAGILKEASTPMKWLASAFAVKKSGPEAFRLVVDYAPLNQHTVPESHPMPIFEHHLQDLEGAKCFAMYDAKKGYYQKKIAPDSQETAAILFPHGVFIPLRVIPGLRNATAAFQQSMIRILGRVNKFTWLDDTLTHSKSVKELIATVRSDLERMKEGKVKLNLEKCAFISTRVSFLGRIFTPHGIQHDPERIRTIQDMGKPITFKDLNKILNALNWARCSIPDYARLAAPLQDIINHAFTKVGSRKNVDVKHVKVDWTPELEQVYDSLIKAFTSNILCCYPSPTRRTFVWCDASDLGYGGMITQLENGSEEHLVLGFTSGKFNSSEMNWDTADKEFYGLLQSLNKFNEILPRSLTVITDHANLEQVLRPTRIPDISNIRHRRLVRWRALLSDFTLEIKIIPGKDNLWADLLSRVNQHMVNALHLIDSTMDDNFEWPSEEEIFKAQKLDDRDLAEVKKDEHGRIWLPSNHDLRSRVYAAAHSWLGGHRSAHRTVNEVSQLFYGHGLIDEIKQWSNNCIHCIAVKGGKTLRRPMGEHLVPEFAGEVIHIDFMFVSKMGKFNNMLVIVDAFSNYVFLYPTKGLTAEEAASGVLLFCSLFRKPEWLVTDAGAAFISELFETLATRMNTKHHICTAYVHMANGKAERYVKLARDTLKLLMAEVRMDPKDWTEMIPVVSSILNDTVSERLGGYTPRMIFLGMNNPTPLQLAMSSGSVKLSEVTKAPNYQALVDNVIKEREDIIKDTREAAALGREKIRDRNIAYNKKWTAKLPKLHVGDLCLVARPAERAKMQFHWTGPYMVTGVQHEFVYKVKRIGLDKEILVHVSRLWQYNGPLIGTSTGIEEQAQHLDKGYYVEKIMDLDYKGSQPVFKIKWEGIEEPSQEPVSTIYEDAEEFVLEYIRNDDRDKLMKRICKYLKLDYATIKQGKA